MAKKTAVVDLGSNSIRMVVFEKTSRFAFYISKEYKRKIRLGENAYNNGKMLQEEAMEKAENALLFLKKAAIKNKCKKVIIIGTSALRDAPNSNYFINKIKNNLNLNIKCIDGKSEAYLGGLAALNLLSDIKNGTTLDIGGGSSELCLIKNGKIVDYISLDLGTVRLKEIFYDKNKIQDSYKFLDDAINSIPEHFKNENLIAIGGSLRAISNSIMQKNSYPLKNLHDFRYKLEDEINYIKKILDSKFENLSNYGIKKDRFDTIKEGIEIFLKISKKLNAKNIITSVVGIREGVYIKDLLRPRLNFPPNFNPSLKSLQDRFLGEKTQIPNIAAKLFDLLKDMHKLNDYYKILLINSAKICTIGNSLNFYFLNEHSSNFAIWGLNYGFSHKEKILISTIIKLNGKKINPYLLEPYKNLLPEYKILTWLNFLLAISKTLSDNFDDEKLEFKLINNNLHIKKTNKCAFNTQKSELKKIFKPNDINIFLDKTY